MKSFTSPEENILNYTPWWLKTRHGVKTVEIDGYEQRPNGLIVHIKGVDDREQAAEYDKVEIAVDKSQLPALEAGEYYWHQLIGLQVVSQYQGDETALGEVKELLETGANDVLVIIANEQSIDDRERLVPYVPGQYVTDVDLEKGLVVVDWDPEF